MIATRSADAAAAGDDAKGRAATSSTTARTVIRAKRFVLIIPGRAIPRCDRLAAAVGRHYRTRARPSPPVVRAVNGTSVIAYSRARSGRLAGVAAITFSSRPTGIGRARLGRLETAARRDRHAAVHAGRHPGHRQEPDAGDLRTAGTQILLANTYHLVAAPRPRADRAPGRAASVHGLGWPDPDRFGRVPGLQPGPPGSRRRRRRDLRQPPGRLAASD